MDGTAVVVGVRLRDTLSFWVTVAAAGLVVHRKTRRAGAVLLMLVGYGGVGVAWERTTGCDLRRFQRPSRLAISGVITHLPIAVLGHVAWHHTSPLLNSVSHPLVASETAA